MDSAGQVTLLCERWEEARRRGEHVTPEELCRDSPALLGEVRAAVRALAAADRRLAAPASDDPAVLPALPAGSRFRLTRFLAQGGLGRVYAGTDHELGREVAVKFVRPDRGHPAARARFRREAEVTGRLEHPGVAAVYGLVELPDGGFCYAMRLLHGKTLADAVDACQAARPADRPAARRGLVRHLISACQTVGFAHSRGVLHRDLKPANIMVGEFGETWVLDWGLAKPADAAPPGPAALPVPADATDTPDPTDTRTGAAVGTPGFMSPEQAAGDWAAVGPAADVYSLGATLAAVLTGRGPRPGEGTAGWLAGAAPAAPAAVARRALATDPAARYPTPLALAADLERWLADEPVTAHREPFATRARRWARRHRTPTTAAVVALVVAAPLGVGLAAVADRARRQAVTDQGRIDEQRQAAEARRAEAERQTLVADESARDAREAVERYYTRVSESRLLHEPGLQPLRAELLATAADFYRKFAATQADRPESRLDYGWTQLRLAKLYQEMGDQAAAVPAAEQGRAGLAAAAAERPGDKALALSVAEADLTLATVYPAARQADAEGALARYRAAVAALTDNRLARVKVDAGAAVLAAAAGRKTASLAASDRSIRTLEGSADAVPLTPDEREAVAMMYSTRAAAHMLDPEQPAAAEGAAVQALELLRALNRDFPRVLRAQELYASVLGLLGDVRKKTGGPAAALPLLTEAADLLDRLVAANPALADLPPLAGTYRHNAADLLLALGRKPEAAVAFAAAAGHREAVLRADPTSRGAADDLIASCNGQVKAGKARAALDGFNAMVELTDKSLAGRPTDTGRKGLLYRALQGRAMNLSRLGAYTDALRDWDRVVALGPTPPTAFVALHQAMAVAYTGDHAGAVAAAEAAGRGDATAGACQDVARVYGVAAATARTAGRDDLVEGYAAAAVGWLRRAADRGDCTPTFLKQNDQLAAVRKRPDFQRLVAEREVAAKNR